MSKVKLLPSLPIDGVGGSFSLLLFYCERLASTCTSDGDVYCTCSSISRYCYIDCSIAFAASLVDLDTIGGIACDSPFILGRNGDGFATTS